MIFSSAIRTFYCNFSHNLVFVDTAKIRIFSPSLQRRTRQTFGNIVKSARKKVSEALITGKAIIIEGGDVTILNKPCPRCKKNRKSCPKCEDKNDEDNLSGE